MTMAVGTFSIDNRNDELVVQWLLETKASLTLTPVQKELKMTKETIILANLAVDFTPLSDIGNSNSSSSSSRMDHQKRFEQLQRYYQQASNKESSKSDQILQLSSRMEIENEEERNKLKSQVFSLLEQLATMAAQELYQELLQEEEQKERQEQRKLVRRRKKKRNKKKAKTGVNNMPGGGAELHAAAPTNDESKQQETQILPDASDGVTSDTLIAPPEIARKDAREEVMLCDGVEESKEDTIMRDDAGFEESKGGDDDGMNDESNNNNNGSFLFDSYIDIAETDDEDDDPDDDFVVIPLGSPKKKTPTTSINSISYIQALGVTPEVSKVMQTQRKEHLEMMQQVQLKAFIAETQATAARERIGILETLLNQVLAKNGMDANLKRTIEITLASTSDC